RQVGIAPEAMFQWPGGWDGARMAPEDLSAADLARLDRSELVLWGSYCGVHMVFETRHIDYWRGQGYQVHVHPECTHEVVSAADGSGSTAYLWKAVAEAQPGDKLAIGTEGHFVRNAIALAAGRGVEIVNLAEVPDPAFASMGCGCATMSRNDPPHLVALLDLLRQGRGPDLNRVLAGDMVDETTGWRERLDEASRRQIAEDARRALRQMITLTEAARG
ncbi:MAG: quinolinate synthase NadA, partial [Myxococcota bacterium]|nr:quinolinate synthase NadA [Myxococcota bacterium]